MPQFKWLYPSYTRYSQANCKLKVEERKEDTLPIAKADSRKKIKHKGFYKNKMFCLRFPLLTYYSLGSNGHNEGLIDENDVERDALQADCRRGG